jgi:hypothetical protein
LQLQVEDMQLRGSNRQHRRCRREAVSSSLNFIVSRRKIIQAVDPFPVGSGGKGDALLAKFEQHAGNGSAILIADGARNGTHLQRFLAGYALRFLSQDGTGARHYRDQRKT